MIQINHSAWLELVDVNRDELQDKLYLSDHQIRGMCRAKLAKVSTLCDVLNALGRTRPKDVLRFFIFDGNKGGATRATRKRDR